MLRGNLNTIFVIVLSCIAVVAQAGWQLTFSDEFNGQTTVNSSAWLTAYSFAPVVINSELQFYSPGGFTFGSDYLRIVGERKKINGFEYQSGVITTNGRFIQTFGFFEIRARWTTGRGLWPAFWLYGQYGGISGSTEIDVLEALLQNPEIAHMTYHCKNKTQSSSGTYTGFELADQDWHTYSVQWAPSIMIWYIDGIQRFNTSTCVPNYPMFILANMAIGGSWPGPPNATTPFPAYMDIDYIRAYKYVPSGGVTLNGPGDGIAFTMPALPTLPVVSYAAAPTLTPNNADRGDNVTFTFTFKVGGTGLTTPMVAMYVQDWMNSSIAHISRTTQLPSLDLATTRTVTYTFKIPETMPDGYYRVVFGVWDNVWTKGVFWQDCVIELGVNSIVGGREMPVVPSDSSGTPTTASPSSSAPSSPQSPATNVNSEASVIRFGSVLVLSALLNLLL